MEAVLDEGVRVPVSGDCMDPVVPEGAEVRMERCSPSRLLPGDVVLLERGGKFVLHRYLARVRVGRRTGLLTKADRRRRPDALWPPGSLVGRLAEITPACPEGRAVHGAEADGRAEAVRRYRPSPAERIEAAFLGFFWRNIAPFLRDARDTLCLRRFRRPSRTSCSDAFRALRD